MLGRSSRVLPRICACSMMHFASQTKKHWDLAESKLNMAASLSYNASWRWKELPSLVPQQERKWQLIDIVPSILCYLLFMVLVWKMWLAKRLENFPKGNLTIRTSMLMLNYLSGREINFFLLIATWLLNFQSGSQFKISWSPFSKTNKTFFFFYAVSMLNRPSKIRLGKRSFILQSGH